MAAIEAGVDPVNFVELMKHAQAEQQVAMEELKHLPDTQAVDVAEVYAMLDQLGDVAWHLNSRSPDRIMQVCRDLGLQVVYDNKKEAVVVTASPRVGNVFVRGPSRPITPRSSSPRTCSSSDCSGWRTTRFRQLEDLARTVVAADARIGIDAGSAAATAVVVPPEVLAGDDQVSCHCA